MLMCLFVSVSAGESERPSGADFVHTKYARCKLKRSGCTKLHTSTIFLISDLQNNSFYVGHSCRLLPCMHCSLHLHVALYAGQEVQPTQSFSLDH